VQEASGQRLRVELYDEDPGSADEELGRISLDLNNVRTKGFTDAVGSVKSVHGTRGTAVVSARRR
jgi:Ca2+-dependent lipid-binding protein